MATIKRKPYFYDQQVKRYLIQIMSCFAGYTVRTGKQRDGKHRFIDVPVVYADMSRAASYILQGQDANGVPSLPIMSVEMTRLTQSNDHRRSPQHVERWQYRPRVETSDGQLTGQPGPMMTAERYMPVPYEMGIRLSIWASNNDQGLQLIEQICTVFNPELDIQLSNSPLDWAFLTTLRFEGDVQFARAAADIGSGSGEDPYYVYNMDFSTIIQLSPPAKVYESSLINTVHVGVKQMNEMVDFDSMDDIDGFVITAGD